MVQCNYKTKQGWECFYEAKHGEKYCYWHNQSARKELTETSLIELKESKIIGVHLEYANLNQVNLKGVYLKSANLLGASLESANLSDANLESANLSGAHLESANLSSAHLESANLSDAHLESANLSGANLESANLRWAHLESANLSGAHLESANLWKANLRTVDLWKANLHKADISDVELQGANLYGVRCDSNTLFENSKLYGVNLYSSYFDEAKSFRNALVFHNEKEKEINEVIGDALDIKTVKIIFKCNAYINRFISKLPFYESIRFLKTKFHSERIYRFLKRRPLVINIYGMKEYNPDLFTEIRLKKLIRYSPTGEVVFYDWLSGSAVICPENRYWWRFEKSYIPIKRLSEQVVIDGEIKYKFLCKNKRISLYQASYEVYNNLYNFYISSGRLDQAAKVHYRREEAHRKLMWQKGGFDKFKSLFNWLIKLLTGYGDKIERPIGISVAIIMLFGIFFKATNGIIKTVDNESVKPYWYDYLYHSITTFTSLGYSNIQPNITAGPWPQILVASESGFGVIMMALIIFVVTYQVSR